MIPILVLLGLAFGRWWCLCLVISSVGWPVLLVATDVMKLEPSLLAAAALAALNAGVGVLVHQAILLAVRRARRVVISSSRR